MVENKIDFYIRVIWTNSIIVIINIITQLIASTTDASCWYEILFHPETFVEQCQQSMCVT